VKQLTAKVAALFCVISCITVAAVEIWPASGYVRTGDQNGDGRIDLWCRYDTKGQVAEIDRDTNFDGLPDVQEYYQRGVLIRRESDRNFNGLTDLVEEFDPATHSRTRSVVDIDDDGTADLLVLFQDGRPVFSKQIRGHQQTRPLRDGHSTPGPYQDRQRLVALDDPSKTETTLRGVHLAVTDPGSIGLSGSGGLPQPSAGPAGRLPGLGRILAAPPAAHSLPALDPRASRAPPLS
jgi:hypothetical protein